MEKRSSRFAAAALSIGLSACEPVNVPETPQSLGQDIATILPLLNTLDSQVQRLSGLGDSDKVALHADNQKLQADLQNIKNIILIADLNQALETCPTNWYALAEIHLQGRERPILHVEQVEAQTVITINQQSSTDHFSHELILKNSKPNFWEIMKISNMLLPEYIRRDHLTDERFIADGRLIFVVCRTFGLVWANKQ